MKLILIRDPWKDGGKYHLPATGERRKFAADAAACRPWKAIPFARTYFEDEVERSEICRRCLATQPQAEPEK